MDDLAKFLNFLYEDQTGYVYVATKEQIDAANIDWQQTYFTWPKEAEMAHDFIATQSAQLDVYVGPALYKTKSGLKSQIKGSNVVWIEFDGQEQIDFPSSDIPEPDVVIQTSDEFHKHCYWKLNEFTAPDAVEEINRRLTYHMDADYACWNINHVLRTPDTFNWKRGGLPVSLIHFDPKDKWKPESFDKAPEIEKPVILLNETNLLDAKKLLQELPLHPKLAKRILSETVAGPQDGKEGARSGFLMKVGHELAEEGCSHIQIVSILNFVDDRIGKFANRRDKLIRLSEIASRALLHIDQDDQPVLYSPFEIINYTEELDWILQGWLHRSGFMIVTGAPSVGKTTFCLQLIHHLATAKNFLNKSIDEPAKVLFISLEMGILELTYFFKKHDKEFDNKEQWNANVKVLGEEFTFRDYEELIVDFEPHVVLIDSLTELAREEMKETEARAITRWIKKCRRRYNCAFICIHHNRKDAATTRKKARWSTTLSDIYGSFIFQKDIDTAIMLEQWDDDETIIDCYDLKTRYDRSFQIELRRNSNLIFNLKDESEADADKSDITVGGNGISLSFTQ